MIRLQIKFLSKGDPTLLKGDDKLDEIVMNKKYILLLVYMLSISSCSRNIEIDSEFIRINGQELVEIFKSYSISYRGRNTIVVDNHIDRDKFRLEDNASIVQDGIYLRFNDLIRFVLNINHFNNSITASYREDHLEDSFYSYSYIHNDSIEDVKKFALIKLTSIINDFHKYNLVLVESEGFLLNGWIRFSFYAYQKDNTDVLLYVENKHQMEPSEFWEPFLESNNVKKLDGGWYAYKLGDFVEASDK